MSDFTQVAPYLDQLAQDANANLRYDLFADALVWSDELKLDENDDVLFDHIGTIRAIWQYRSTLILGTPCQRFEAAWQEAQRLCPNWPVFLPQRRDPSLARTYVHSREVSQKKWGEDVTRIERQLDDSKRKATV